MGTQECSFLIAPQKNRRLSQQLSDNDKGLGAGKLQRGEFRKFAVSMGTQIDRENTARSTSFVHTIGCIQLIIAVSTLF